MAVGWFGGACGHCTPCRQGDFIVCENLRVPGWAYDGGYAQTAVVPVDALARIPDALAATDAGPLACAGVTMFNGLRRSSARSGDLVAVLGIGGLGHLGVKYAAAMGFETVAIARGGDKADFAKQLGAHHYVDSTAGTAADALQSLGVHRSSWPPRRTPPPSPRPWMVWVPAVSWWSSAWTRSRSASPRPSC